MRSWVAPVSLLFLAIPGRGTDFPVAVVSGGQSTPDVACAAGISLVVWQDGRDSATTGADVYAARVSDSGAVLDPAGIPVSNLVGPQMYPKVASDGDGFLVVWEDDGDGDNMWQVRAARVTADGATPDGPGVIVVGGSLKETHPDVAWTGSHYLVAWQHCTDGVETDVHVARVAADGSLMDDPPVVADDETYSQDSIALAAGPGVTLLAYRECAADLFIKGVLVHDDGQPPSAFMLANASGTQKSPAAAFGDGVFLVAWEDYRAGNCDVFAARVGTDGTVLDSGAALHIGIATTFDTNRAPSVTFDGARFVVAWDDDRNAATGFDVYRAGLDAAGDVVEPGALLVTSGGDQTLVSAASGGAATVFAWADDRYGSPIAPDVFACVLQTNATPSASASFAPPSPGEGDTVTLDGSASQDPEGTPLAYLWTQVSGPDAGAIAETQEAPTFVAPESGAPYDLVFSLKVSDGRAWSDPCQVTVPVQADDDPPFAVAGDVTATECDTVTLDGTASYDPEGGALTFEWVQQGAPLVGLDDPAAAAPSFTAPEAPADYTLTFALSVRDATQACAAPAEVTVLVACDDDPPVADAGGQMSVVTGSQVILDGTGSCDPEGKPLVYGWAQLWGAEVVLQDSQTATPTFTSPDSDQELVLVFMLTVTDEGGGEDTDRAEVWVSPTALAAPVASAIQGVPVSYQAACVTWDTDLDAKGLVSYGTTLALGFESEEAAFAVSHQIDLVDLRAGATYFFRVRSTGTGGAWSVSDTDAFTTPEPSASDDLDGDGIPDDWEDANGLDPGDPYDALKDPDRDGLTNLREYRHATDRELADTDSDGFPDGYEVRLGSSPLRSDSVPSPSLQDEPCGAGAAGLPAVAGLAAALLLRRRRRARLMHFAG